VEGDAVIVSFTGPEEIDGDDARYVREVVAKIVQVPQMMFVTGGAVGVDTVVARAAREFFPDAHHLVVVPGRADCRWNRDLRREFEVRYGPERSTTGATYMARNDLLVRYADELYAFPWTSDEEGRSGTWATIRRARKASVPIKMFPLREREEQTCR
jgi:hypothetical protein